jgi:hypothetical protein
MTTLTLDIAQASLLDPVEEEAPPHRPPERREAPAPLAAAPAVTAPASAPAVAAPASAPAVAAPAAAPAVAAPAPASDAPLAAAPARSSARTLDDIIARARTTLGVTQAADCPLCGGDLAPRFGSGPHPVGAACRSCGTELS